MAKGQLTLSDEVFKEAKKLEDFRLAKVAKVKSTNAAAKAAANQSETTPIQ